MPTIILLEPEVDAEFKLTAPPYQGSPSLWFFYLGTYLKKQIPGAEIVILDGRFVSTADLPRWAKKIKPDFVGISPKYILRRNKTNN